MSRALGKDVVAALKSYDGAKAFEEISQALIHPTCEGLLDIEFLGRSHPIAPGTNFLQDGNAIAIPKTALVPAFLVACKLLKMKGTEVSHEDINAATAVILLMDPEHLTAANRRKKLVQMHHGESNDVAHVMAEERRFVDSLLTSRLHRHTKSPTLWSHRQWLVDIAWPSVRVDIADDIMNVVMVSGERHPRNYYAWCHARELMAYLRTEQARPQHIDAEKERRDIISATKGWCCKNHTDTSGWSFLYFLLFDFGAQTPELCSSIVVEIARLAASLRWENESVWVFLRTAAASSGTVGREEQREIFSNNAALRARHLVDSHEGKILRRAEEWFETYRQTSS